MKECETCVLLKHFNCEFNKKFVVKYVYPPPSFSAYAAKHNVMVQVLCLVKFRVQKTLAKPHFVWLVLYCHSLSSSAFVSSPLYGPSCFPVIISSVSVSLVLIMSQVSPVMSPYISLFYPMLPVDYY